MDESQGRGGPQMNGDAANRTPEEVQAEIEETRAELGDTVEALVAKTDVKGQAKQAVTDAKATVAGKAADVKQTVTGKKDDVTAAVQETTPENVTETGRRAVALAQDNRPVLIAAGTFALGLLIGSRRGR
jgi:type IV secretory pathway VirB10-like protein